MGFSGSFILAGVADPEELDWIDGEPFESTLLASRTGDWLCASYDDEDAYWTRTETLARLVEQTERPALIALCLDSDFLAVAGRLPDGTGWDAVVYADAAAGYREEGLLEGYDEVVPQFMEPAEAVSGGVAWATAAGLVPDDDALTRLFTLDAWQQPAEAFWGELLDALGFRDG